MKPKSLPRPVSARPKIFVLDTNVILHDQRSVFNFQENDIVIPLAVIEELDKFKKQNDTLGFHAREFVREIDRISDNALFTSGVPLGKGRGTIKVEPGHAYTPQMRDSLIDDIPDHRIIATAIGVQREHPDRKVILVTKDMNMRLKAKALGMPAQDYLTDKVKEERVEHTKKEITRLGGLHGSLVEKLKMQGYLDESDLPAKRRPRPNQLFRIPDGKDTLPVRYDAGRKAVVRVHCERAYGILPRNEEQCFALEAVMNPDVSLVSLTGSAGTGKTLLALAGALAQADRFDQIILSRPVIPLRNQDLGFLPGSVNEKISPYMLPLFDNLAVIRQAFRPGSPENVRIDEMLRKEKLVISPLAYIRGRSLNKVFFIVDEAQNLTPHEIKTIVTRAGDGTKIVFTGDIFQIDQPYLDIHSNGLTHIGEKLAGQPLFEHVNLIRGERSRLSELAGKLL